MATAWQTLEEAALTLGISSRTLHRRLAKNEFETRLANGRREVLITLPDPIGVTDGSAEGSNPSVIIPDPVRQSSDDVQDTMLMLHEDRIRRTDLAIMAYQQSVSTSATAARRATINSRIAWSTVGGLAIMLFLSVIWATHRVTRAQAEVEHLNNEVRQLSDTSTQVSRQADTLRQTAESAKVTAARAEGELAATAGARDPRVSLHTTRASRVCQQSDGVRHATCDNATGDDGGSASAASAVGGYDRVEDDPALLARGGAGLSSTRFLRETVRCCHARRV